MLYNRENKGLYRKVALDLRNRILAGEWKVGDRLPSAPKMVAEYGLSSMGTVSAVWDVLRNEGLIETVQGKGTFVTSTAPTITYLQALELIDSAILALEQAKTTIVKLQEQEGKHANTQS